MGLISPDGVFMAVFMTAALCLFTPRAIEANRAGDSGDICRVRGDLFRLALALFWLSTAANSFYRKGGGHLHWDGFRKSNGNTIKMLLPLIPVSMRPGYWQSRHGD